ncbi:MAG: hypothetical protein ABJD13_13985 [Paracoccaceae bacterium]
MSSRAIKAVTTYQLERAACIACHLEDWCAAPAQIVAFEKAAVSMARGAKQKFSNMPIFVVTNYENTADSWGQSFWHLATPFRMPIGWSLRRQ